MQAAGLLMVLVARVVQGGPPHPTARRPRHRPPGVLVMEDQAEQLVTLVLKALERPQVAQLLLRGHLSLAQLEQLEIQVLLVMQVLAPHLVELVVQRLLRGQHVLAQVEQLVILAQQVMLVLGLHLVMLAVQRLLRGQHVLA